MGYCRWVLVALIAVLALPATASPAAEPKVGPQPLTAAERQGVQLALQYMAGGAAAWWPELARGSWLRALGQEAAIAEIETRAGPQAGSHWTLQAAPAEFAAHGAAFTIVFPSGADDTLLLELAEEGGAWRIASLRGSARPGRGARGGPAVAGAAVSAGDRAGGAAVGGARGARPWRRMLPAILLAASGCAAIAV